MKGLNSLLVSALLCASVGVVSVGTINAHAKKETKKEAAKETKANAGATAGTSKQNPEAMTVMITDQTKSVKQGEKASVSIHTVANAKCTIEVKLKSGKSSASGLAPVKADNAGNAKWEWTVAKNTTPGDMPFNIIAKVNKEKAEASGVIKVEPADNAKKANETGAKTKDNGGKAAAKKGK